MATNRHAVIRYLALDKCFRNIGRKYYFEDLLDVCQQAIEDFCGEKKGIQRRQLYDDIRFMQSEAGYSIELEESKDGRRRYYRYKDPKFTIGNRKLNDVEVLQVKETLLLISRFRGLPHFEWVEETITKFEANLSLKKGAQKIVAFAENKDYLAVKYVNPLFNAILNKNVLNINYQSFKLEKSKSIIFHPYYLKQYNNRWFCFGMSKGYASPTTLALDRILGLEISNQKYIPNKSIDFETYFDDVVGVTVQGSKQKITIKISNSLWPYIKSKPLHSSQELISEGREVSIISILVKPNYELESLLLSHGNDLEIIEPKAFKRILLDRSKYRKI